MSSWLDSSDNANCFKQTYVQGFVDISGGSIITRGPNDGIVIGGDSSLNGTVYLGDSMFVRSDGLVAPPVFVDASYVDVSGGAFIGDVISYDISGGPTVEGSTFLGVSVSSDSSWSQLGFDIDGEAASDKSGYSVSLINSATYGRVVAIGAPYNDGTETSASDNRGHVRVYQHRTITETSWTNYNKANTTYAGKPIVIGASGDVNPVPGKKYWVQLGADIDGEAAGDQSGWSVSLVDSSIGLVVAIVANQNDGAETSTSDNRGHVRVYQYDANKTEAIITDASANYGPIGWNRLGADIDGEAEGDNSGQSVSLVDSSTIGLVVAIGAYNNDGIVASRTFKVRSDGFNYTIDGFVGNFPVITLQANTIYYFDVSEVSSSHPFALRNSDGDTTAVSGTTNNDPAAGAGRHQGSANTIITYTRTSTGSIVYQCVNHSNMIGTINIIANDNRGHVRVYQYDASKNSLITDQDSPDYGPIGWRRLGADIDGELGSDNSGISVSLVDSSTIGLVVAIGAYTNDGATTSTSDNRGHVRVYQYDASKNSLITEETSPDYGPIGWRRLGADIDGEAAGDNSGRSVSLVDSSIGLVVAIGATLNDGTPVLGNRGHVRVYQYDATKTEAIITDASANYGPIGWNRLGADIDGEAAGDLSGQSVSLVDSSDGLVVAIGSYNNDGSRGHVRVYQYDASKNTLITNQNSSDFGPIGWRRLGADIDGEAGSDFSGVSVSLVDSSTIGLVVAIGAINNDGIVASRTFKVRSDGFNYTIDGFAGNFPVITLQANTIYYFDVSEVSSSHPFALRNSDGDTTAVSGTTNNDPAAGRHQGSPDTIITYNRTSTGTIVYQCVNHSNMIGTINIIASDNRGHVRVYEIPYTNVYSDVSGGFLDVQVASNGATAIYVDASYADVSGGQFFGDVVSYDISGNAANGATVSGSYLASDASWSKLGFDIDGEASTDWSGYSVSLINSATYGRVVAIGANQNDGNGGNAGHVRVYQYDASKNALITDQSSSDYGPIGWRRLGADIDGEAIGDESGYSVSLVDASGGLVVAIGALQNDAGNATTDNRGHVRVYQYINSSWSKLGDDIDGEALSDYSGHSVSLVDASGGLVVAIGARNNDGTQTSTSDNRGHVRVYKYDATKTSPQLTDQGQPNFGPIGWNRLGADIDGEAAGDWSGWSVSLVDASGGIVVAIGAQYNAGGRGHVRVYQYRQYTLDMSGNYHHTSRTSTTLPLIITAANDTAPQYGTYYWTQTGFDIDGEATIDFSGYSVSLVDSANGPVVAIGAYQNVSLAGHVRVYQYRQYTSADANKYHHTSRVQNTTQTKPLIITASNTAPDINKYYWTQTGFDINGEGGRSGWSVSLVDASGGLVVAIGAKSIEGDSGHVRVYQYRQYTLDMSGNYHHTSRLQNTSTQTKPLIITANNVVPEVGTYYWTQTSLDIDGEAAGDQSGSSVSLADSANGLVVAIGAPMNDGNGGDSGHVRVYEIPYTKVYSDVSGGYYDVSVIGGYLNDGKTTAALYVNGDTDLSGGLTVGGDVSFNAGNLFVAGDLSLNGNLFINSFAPNSINADAIDSTVNIEFANKLSVSVADLSFNKTALKVATDFSLNNTLATLATNLTVPANIAIVDGSNGTVYGSYLTLTNKAATAYYNVGKSASGLFNIVDQANAGVYLASGGTSFTGTSDARLKTNIAPLESATDKIMALNPCTYQWKSDADNTTENKTQTKTHIGFIAQEVEKIMPELVHPIDHPAGSDYKGVNTTDLIPYLVRTIQENARKLAELRAGVDAYKNQ
jgi:plastocyanin